jgi:hypothetical protein
MPRVDQVIPFVAILHFLNPAPSHRVLSQWLWLILRWIRDSTPKRLIIQMSRTQNIRRRNRSMQLSVESCEERIVPVAPVVALPLKFLGEYAVSKVMDKITGLGNSAEFREINQKLDQLTAAVGQLQTSIDQLQVSNDRQTLYQITEKLKISKIDSYWGTFNRFIDLKLANTPADKKSVETLANQIIEELRTTVADFKDAFNGQGVSSEPLMTAYSKLIRKSVTNKVNGNRSDPFLDSNYSTAMVNGYDYYTSEGVKAAILLANAYTYLGITSLANGVRNTLPTPFAKGAAKDQWTRQYDTLPKHMIPDIIVVDTGTNRAWSQFETMAAGSSGSSWGGQFTWSSLNDLALIQDFLNGKLGSTPPRLYNWSGASQTEKNMAEAVRKQAKSGLHFEWHVPKKTDIGNQPDFYTSRGFSQAYSQPIWTDELPLGVSRCKPGGVAIKLLQFSVAQAVFYAPIKNHEFFV